MKNTSLNTATVADLARQSRVKLYEIFDAPECQPFLPPKAGIGETRRFNPNQALLLMIHSDLNRWGLSVPFAGKVAARIGEALAERPGAERAVVSFHANGSSVFIATDDELGELASEGFGAGRVRFRLALELAAYRDAIRAALADRALLIGADDD
jgi:hypothetical protein